ncbi:MAG TPA: cell wall hydrolase [Allosphingosinicella sp.]|jgi:spore germination cell wall hydrolase CwlJ-like protein
MMKWLAAAALSGLIVFAAQARDGGEAVAPAKPAGPVSHASDWSEWTRPLQPEALRPRGTPHAAVAHTEAAQAPISDEDIDVVDAHWMALTMWGEARNQGEEGMRAVGHVIANRRAAKTHGTYVTDTVSAAWQFSCWNKNDPNRALMLAIEDLPEGGAAHRQWLAAKRIAAEILAGRSADPTGGALFYHTTAVSPAWSRGEVPVTQIGSHLFFRTAR